MMRKFRPAQHRARKKAAATAAANPAAYEEYRVGPGRPPKEYQFKPGQSGNPKGARRKPKSMVPDLKALLEAALSGKVTLVKGEREVILSKAAAGVEQLVNAFAQGDRHARRDLIDMAQRLGLDLIGSAGRANGSPQSPGSTEDEAVLADFFRRYGKMPGPPEESSSETTGPPLRNGETDESN